MKDLSHAAAMNALRDRGISDPEAFRSLTPDAIEGTCRWFDAQNGRVGTGVLVAELKAGGKPGWRPMRPADLMAEQETYFASVRDWLIAKMPDVCKQDPKVVAGHRRCYGDAEATRLAISTAPHYAAAAAVYRLHQRHGKGSLTVRQHGPEIRAAVRAANAEAVADYERIASKREKE